MPFNQLDFLWSCVNKVCLCFGFLGIQLAYLFILISGFSNGSRISTNRIGCWIHEPMKSQMARFKIKKAVAFLRIFLYLRMKYITNAFPTVARIMHIACKIKVERLMSKMAEWGNVGKNKWINAVVHIFSRYDPHASRAL